jgi:hypothetical protein
VTAVRAAARRAGASGDAARAGCIATYKIVDGGIVVWRKRTGEERAEECVPLSRYDLRAAPRK